MYEAKQRGPEPSSPCSAPSCASQAVARLELENALRVALRADEMQLQYQPIVSLVDGSLKGYEALLRWQRPGVGIVESQRLRPRRHRDRADRRHRTLGDPGGRRRSGAVDRHTGGGQPRPPASSSTPTSSTSSPTASPDNDLPAERLCLEVTESDLMADPQTSGDVLRQLKELGVRLAIDDFGTGLRHARLRPAVRRGRHLEDRRLVRRRDHRPEVAGPGHRRGVPGAGPHARVRDRGRGRGDRGAARQLVEPRCELAQGHLFSEPVPAELLPSRAPSRSSRPRTEAGAARRAR